MSDVLFDRLKSLGEELIIQMIESEQQESLTLDFKANVEKPGEPLFENEGKKLTKTGRRTLAKAASAFANSMGGVLVIGIDCRAIEGIDCARQITPIPFLSRALSTINNELHSITVPPIGGIEAMHIPIEGGSSGLIVLSIPRSARRPHRSSATGAKSYYKRSGTSTVEMEHYEIEEAFLSNLAPELVLTFAIISSGSGGSGAEPGERKFSFVAQIIAENFGGGLAKHIFFQCQQEHHVLRQFGEAFNPSKNQIGVVDGVQQVALPSDLVVHPGTKRIIEKFPIEAFFNKETNEMRVGDLRCKANSAHLFEFVFLISAEGMRQKRQTVEFELRELISSGTIPAK
ncbi:MAG: ATP-binding protein [Alphaproteobacteria bacterium]|nr:ATP-binding protein [Alphaproteobacteria bacterium]